MNPKINIPHPPRDSLLKIKIIIFNARSAGRPWHPQHLLAKYINFCAHELFDRVQSFN